MPPKRQQLTLNASEKADGYGRRYTIKPQASSEQVKFGLGDDDEEEESTASQRSKNFQQHSAASTSARQKRKTQFPDRFSVFALTSMRQSIMIKQKPEEEEPEEEEEEEDDGEGGERKKGSKFGSLFKRKKHNKRVSISSRGIYEGDDSDDEDKPPKKSKKIIIIRRKKNTGARVDDAEWRKKSHKSAYALLGLDEKSIRELIGETGEDDDESWKKKSSASALAMLGLNEGEDDFEIMYCDDEDLEDNVKDELEGFTVDLDNDSDTTITVMEEFSQGTDDDGNPITLTRGLSLFAIGGKMGILQKIFSKEDKSKEMSPPAPKHKSADDLKRRDEYVKMASSKWSEYKEEKKGRKSKKKGDSDSEDEDRPPVYNPYYHT